MKKFIITIALSIGMIACVVAQGIKITYLENVKASEADTQNLTSDMQKIVAEQLAQQNKTMCLYAAGGESLYATAPAETDESLQPNNPNVSVVVVGGSGSEGIYKNQKEHLRVSQSMIIDRKFIIEEPLTPPAWTLSQEEKTVAGFVCKKATDATGDVAWYTPQIPVQDGPGTYFGLPGLILEVDIQTLTIVAQDINLNCDVSSLLKRPETGKKITREAFDKLKKKKTKAMGLKDNKPGVTVETETVTM